MPHAALVHDHFTGPTGMGLVVGRHARWLLEAGWTVTLVGDNVPDDLAGQCRVVAVPRPRKLPSLPEHLVWCQAATRALRWLDPRADLVHVHSPLLAGRADLVTSHFMSQPSHVKGARELVSGFAGVARRMQGHLSRQIDHRAYMKIGTETPVSFVSEFLRDEYVRAYGSPRGGWILAPPAPPTRSLDVAARASARDRFNVPSGVICVGYLGGADPRKGWPHLNELAGDDGLCLLAGGRGSEHLSFAGRRGFGFVDVDAFHAACDVVVAPAVFDSAPVAVLQAVASGLPVAVSANCGWARAIERTRAGSVWRDGESLGAAVRRAIGNSTADRRADFLDEFSERRQRSKLLAVYTTILADAPKATAKRPPREARIRL